MSVFTLMIFLLQVKQMRSISKILMRWSPGRMKREKCAFMLPKIDYLGRVFSADGLQPSPSKVSAILEAPAPCNVSQLPSFLGMVNYYGIFLHQLSTLLSLLYQLSGTR